MNLFKGARLTDWQRRVYFRVVTQTGMLQKGALQQTSAPKAIVRGRNSSDTASRGEQVQTFGSREQRFFTWTVPQPSSALRYVLLISNEHSDAAGPVRRLFYVN